MDGMPCSSDGVDRSVRKPRIIFEVVEAVGIDQVVTPRRATENSAGYDVRAALARRAVIKGYRTDGVEVGMTVMNPKSEGHTQIEIPPGMTAVIPLGFKATMPAGYEAQVRPRSGTSLQTGLRIANAPGTIDADFPDEWCALLWNAGPTFECIKDGERIAQIVFNKFEVMEFVTGTVAQTTDRAGGYGSTGTA